MKRYFLLLVFIVAACGPQKRDEMHSPSPVSLHSEETPYPEGLISANLLCDVSGESDACVVDIDDLPYANMRPCTKAVEGEARIMHKITKKFHVDASGHLSRPVVKEKACPKGFEREDVAEGVFDVEVKAIEDTLESMAESGIIWRLPKTAIIMQIDDKDMRNTLALAAFRSDEWRRSYGKLYLRNSAEERSNAKQYKQMNALTARLLLSTGAFESLERMLKAGGIKIHKLEADQIETEKFSLLHLKSPEATDKEDIYVPVHAYFAIVLEKR